MARCGTRSAYINDRCRCGECRAANAAYQSRRAARAANPTLDDVAARPVDAAPVRAHLEALTAAGVGLRAVSAASGVSRSRLALIRSGEGRTVLPATRDAVLAVTPSNAAQNAVVDATVTWRRISDLLAAGWTRTRIAEALGQRSGELQLGRKRITKANADRIEELWRAHVADRHPDRRSRSRDVEELFEAIAELPRLRSEPWRADAACAGAPTRVFFPDAGTDPHPLAVDTCRRCPVAGKCASSRRGDSGVRAGITGDQPPAAGAGASCAG